MSHSTEHNAALHIDICPGSDYFSTLQNYLRSQGYQTRQLTDTEQADIDRMSRTGFLRFAGSKIKQETVDQLTEYWPRRPAVHKSIFQSIANYSGTQDDAENKAEDIKIPYHHPEGSWDTGLDLSINWQFAEPLSDPELVQEEPNASLSITVSPNRRLFALLKSRLQHEGFATRESGQEGEIEESMPEHEHRTNAATEVYWYVDKLLSEHLMGTAFQARIKRNIYFSIANYSERSTEVEGNVIEMRLYDPRGLSTTLDLSCSAIPIRTSLS